MGYFQNKHSSFKEAAYYRNCANCGTLFHAHSPRQKTCSREENPECDDDIISIKQFASGRHEALKSLPKWERQDLIIEAKKELYLLKEKMKSYRPLYLS